MKNKFSFGKTSAVKTCVTPNVRNDPMSIMTSLLKEQNKTGNVTPRPKYPDSAQLRGALKQARHPLDDLKKI